ncbi:MAG: TrkH family potassium uptake protein [Treponema sp.]|nr:TrkH family potassium uptake protein [Treponema sp.]
MAVISFFKILSILLAIVGATFVIPLSVAFAYSETSMYLPFIIPMAASLIFCAVITFATRKKSFSMTTKQTFLIVALSWICSMIMGAFPLYFSGCFNSFCDALFESFSGFTTTGATILSEVESLPRSVNMLRCLSHWLGGMGIVTLTVAIMPLLGVGGFQLIKAETTGPQKGKVTSRITTTAKVLWLMYFLLTLLEFICLKIAGMDFVDALSHALATLGTGGFSTKNASIGQYNSLAIDIICTVFMFLAGINFSLYYYLIARKFVEIRDNSELKAYLAIILVAVAGITISILPVYKTFGTSLRYSSFQVASLLSTTGFSTADYLQWPSSAQFWLFILFFIGGCSGSTSGGFKVIRWVILGKLIGNETKKMLHPHGVFTVRLNNSPVKNDISTGVAAFTTLYFGLIAITTFAGCLGHLDLYSAFTGAVSIVGNVGPAFGKLGPSFNYGFLPDFVKYWYCFAMIAGRLELYTIIIFFMPEYWKK